MYLLPGLLSEYTNVMHSTVYEQFVNMYVASGERLLAPSSRGRKLSQKWKPLKLKDDQHMGAWEHGTMLELVSAIWTGCHSCVL